MHRQPSDNDSDSPSPHRTIHSLPTGIWVLGFVSMFMDISSELIHSLLPVFMGTVLGASMSTIGWVEGVAEATASITKIFSGVISDYLGKRKWLAALGYGLAAMTKPVFPLANSIAWVFGARFVDRIGKGIRGAPRDALVADIAPRELRGAAYGLRQSLDSLGAFLGPLLALLFMALLADNIRLVLWIAVVPALLSVSLIVFGVQDPEDGKTHSGPRNTLTFKDASRLTGRYWLVVLLGLAFTLARFSEAFLILRAQDVGLGLGFVPLVLVVMNVVYTITAYPVGAAADRVSQRTLLIVGILLLIAADIALAATGSPAFAIVGAGLWGMHMGFTQGLFSKLVADSSPSELRGAAFGIFNLVTGCALLAASVLAGALWSAFGASATFYTGAVFATVALIGLVGYRRKR
ncbi:MAG: MFS transporter [Candidatus Omnitrophica bacterium]|nr:MFS transporter [Candidatus Omnitrophota bacterium]